MESKQKKKNHELSIKWLRKKKIKNHKNKDEILTSKHNNKKNQVCNMFFYIKKSQI
jgi:hypothetical protein